MAHQRAKKILRVKTAQEKTDMQATRDPRSQSTKDTYVLVYTHDQ